MSAKKKVITVFCETNVADRVISLTYSPEWRAMFFDEDSSIATATRRKLSDKDRLYRITIERIDRPIRRPKATP